MNSVVTSTSEHVPAIAEIKPDATQLAIDRTRLAFERTTMAWVRTATSLITFGFSVYKFFHIEPGKDVPDRLIGPREFALMMISIGIFSLVVATVQHWHSMQSLRAHAPHMKIHRSLAIVVGALMSVLGVLALIAVILRR
jgi:putative membrane protein